MVGCEFEHAWGFQTALKSLNWRGFLVSIELYCVGDDVEVKRYGNSFAALKKIGGGVLEMNENAFAGSAKAQKMTANGCNIIPFLECWSSARLF